MAINPRNHSLPLIFDPRAKRKSDYQRRCHTGGVPDAASSWMYSPFIHALRDLSPLITAVIALLAAGIAWWNINKQIRANAGNLDKQIAANAAEAARSRDAQAAEAVRSREAQSAEARRGRQSQIEREVRSERRDALVNVARIVHELRELANDIYWIRQSATDRTGLLNYDHSAEATKAIDQKINAAETELLVHSSILAVLGLQECVQKLDEFRYAFTDYLNGRVRERDVSEVHYAGRELVELFASTIAATTESDP